MQGFARTAKGLLDMGLIDPNPSPFLHPSGPDITWVSVLPRIFQPWSELREFIEYFAEYICFCVNKLLHKNTW